MAEEFIPIAFFIMIGAIVLVPAWLKSKERKEMQATLRSAIEKGQPLPPEVIDSLSTVSYTHLTLPTILLV